MARRAPLIVKKTKKSRVTRSEAYLVNYKYMGDEPDQKGTLTEAQYTTSLNWYNAMMTGAEAREYLLEYLHHTDRKNMAKILNRVKDQWINNTAAAIGRMHVRGMEMPPEAMKFLESKITSMCSRELIEEPKDKGNVISIQERMREKTADIIGDIEQMIDSGAKFSLYDWLKGKAIPASYSTAIIAYYGPWLNELIEAYETVLVDDNDDDQLIDAYRYMTKKQIGERVKFMHNLIEDASRYGNVTKKMRAPRKPRAVSTEKKLKYFKFQKESNDYKIASINPDKIFGAKELWTFNTKYKIITVFRAIDRGGLQINRSSITGYDEATSISKGTGRKPEIVLDKFAKSSIIVLGKMITALKTDKALQVRINENTILLKVV
jgi:hypothetical protein